MGSLAPAKDFYNRNLKKYMGIPKGSSENEIEELEKYFGEKLPIVYKDYLRWMGNDTNGVLRGSNCFLEDVIENTETLTELLEGNKVNYKLPEKYLVFFEHQGYMASWFALPAEDEDPECFHFSEGRPNTGPKMAGDFSTLMNDDIIGMGKITLELYRNKKWWQFWKKIR